MADIRSRSQGRLGARDGALLEITAAITSQPNLQSALNTTFARLSRIIPFGLVALLPWDETRGLPRVFAGQISSGHSGKDIEIGRELSLKGTAVGLAADQQIPVLIENGQAELRNRTEIAAHLKGEHPWGLYVFPVSTPRRRLGALVVITGSHSLDTDEVKLMGCVAPQAGTRHG